eukprot:s480_g9.t1
MDSLNAQELEILRKLMKRAKHDGSLAQLMNEPGCASWMEFPVAATGSMTDGSKRRLFSPTASDDDEFEGEHVMVPKSSEAAQLPLPRAGHPVTIPMDLPDHVESMEMWGATIIDFGKYKNQDMTCAELYAARETDQRADAYVKWVMAHGEKSSGHLFDLFKYVSALMKSHGVNELHDGQLPRARGPGAPSKGGEAHGEILRDPRRWDQDIQDSQSSTGDFHLKLELQAGRTLLLPMGRLPSTSVAETLVKGLRLAAQQGVANWDDLRVALQDARVEERMLHSSGAADFPSVFPWEKLELTWEKW